MIHVTPLSSLDRGELDQGKYQSKMRLPKLEFQTLDSARDHPQPLEPVPPRLLS